MSAREALIAELTALILASTAKTLDEESRKLIEQFCALNPGE